MHINAERRGYSLLGIFRKVQSLWPEEQEGQGGWREDHMLKTWYSCGGMAWEHQTGRVCWNTTLEGKLANHLLGSQDLTGHWITFATQWKQKEAAYRQGSSRPPVNLPQWIWCLFIILNCIYSESNETGKRTWNENSQWPWEKSHIPHSQWVFCALGRLSEAGWSPWAPG